LHGVAVADPYRWMEDVDAPETLAWIAEENKHTRAWLDQVAGREANTKRMRDLMNHTRGYGAVKRAGRVFFMRQDALQNQPVLYVQDGGAQPKPLLDANTLSKDGTVALSSWAPSPNGKYLAYGIAKAGSDWQEWFVRDVATGKDLADRLEWIKFSDPEWSAGSDGVYYTTYPEPAKGALLTGANVNSKLYFHKLGAAQSDDALVFARPDQPEWRAEPWVSDDGNYLLLMIHWGTRTETPVFYQDLRARDGKTREVVKDFIGEFTPLGNQGSTVYFWTTAGAPKGRVIAMDLNKPEMANWKEIVPEGPDAMEQAVWSAGHLFCQYMRDAKSAVVAYTLEGKKVREVGLPGLGSVTWSKGERNENEQFFTFASFVQPNVVYRYDWKAAKLTPLFDSKLPFDPSRFETQQVFYKSKDGTRIPMFLTGRKGWTRDGKNPTLLYGYGGFNVPVLPGFNARNVAWMEQGGVYAVANLRGGSEYGDAWHKAGMLKNKQNVFDDFIAAAEYLIAEKVTQKSKLAIMGGSNGGLLVGACLNQRPDLFGAAIPAVGVMDMLRFHKFTIGKAWASDYGDPDKREDFEVVRKYSPLHNIKPGTEYPPTLVMTADHDDRVVPSHSFKYAAALQHAQEGKAPILIRIATSAGHGAGKPVSKQIDEAVDVLAFLKMSLGM
jgi:prolyl oligopeptidase